MNWSDIGRKVADAAPLLGAALGGPAGATLGALVASTLGTGASPADVMKKLQTDPAAFIRVQELEQQERDNLRAHVLSIAQAEMADQQNARHEHKDHWMPSAMTLMLTLLICAVVAGLFYVPVPPDSKEVLYLIVGQLLGAFATAVSFWLGSSRSSATKDKLLAAQRI